MSDKVTMRTGQVSVTPEGGPIDQGVPASGPGVGQVQATPEAGPLSEGETLVPPTWREHMKGPILGLDDTSASGAQAGGATPASAREEATRATAQDEEELKKWPPYSGKPVSEFDRDAAMRYAAPVVAQAEKLTIKAIDLSARGLSKLARYLEARRQEREQESSDSQ